jgi:hypothetical protein
MTYKICQIIFSTNRLEYLIPTLKAQKNLNFYGCDVHKIFIDDYPKTRNNLLIRELVKLYGYEEIHLHEQNQGLSSTWSETWDMIKNRGYDYIWHQEDDVEILEPVLITDLIEILEKNPDISQVQLARQAWYHHEVDPVAMPEDIVYKNFRYQKNNYIFSPMASLYSSKIVDIPYRSFHDFNLNEGLIGNVLGTHYKMTSANVKNFYGKNIIRHIGNWFVGKRVLPNEPGYEQFGHFNPDIKYNSKDGSLYV